MIVKLWPPATSVGGPLEMSELLAAEWEEVASKEEGEGGWKRTKGGGCSL